MMAPATNMTVISPLAHNLSLEASGSLPVSLFQASVCALQIWDIVLTYDQEIELVWKVRSNAVNYLFFIVRYLALSVSLTTVVVTQSRFKAEDQICGFYTWYTTIANVVLVCTTDILLVYRAFAFYERNRRVLIGLVVLWVSLNLGSLVFTLLIVLKLPVTHSMSFFIRGVLGECVAVGLPQLVHAAWIFELAFQICLVTLVSIKVVRLTIASWATSGICTFYYVLVRDELWCFLIIFLVSLISAFQTNPSGIALIQTAVLLLGTAGSRLILNLRNLKTVSCARNSDTYFISGNRIESEVLFGSILPDSGE